MIVGLIDIMDCRVYLLKAETDGIQKEAYRVFEIESTGVYTDNGHAFGAFYIFNFSRKEIF